MDVHKLVGRNFKRLRLAKRLTQEEVTILSGFSQQYVSGLETGVRNPSIRTLSEIAQALGVSFWDLVRPSRFSEEMGYSVPIAWPAWIGPFVLTIMDHPMQGEAL